MSNTSQQKSLKKIENLTVNFRSTGKHVKKGNFRGKIIKSRSRGGIQQMDE